MTTRRRSGAKAIEARILAHAIVAAHRAGDVRSENAAYDALARLVSRGNVAYHVLTAENEGSKG